MLGSSMAAKRQVIRLKQQSVNDWKWQQARHFYNHLTVAEIRQGAEVRLVRSATWKTLDPAKVRLITEVVAERDGHANRYAVLACMPGTFRGVGGDRPGSGRKAGGGQGYRHKYQTKLPQDAYQQAVQLCIQKGGPANHGERVRYLILQGAIAHQTNHPASRIDFGRGSDVLSTPENIRFTDEQVIEIEKCRQPGESTYKLMQRLFQVGVRYSSEPTFPPKPRHSSGEL